MAEDHPTKPLTPSKYPKSHEDEPDTSISTLIAQSKKRRQKKIVWSSISCIFILVILITALALVFRVKDPEIKMRRVTIPPLNLSGAAVPLSVKIVADVAIKNPNAAAFRYRNSTTFLYYNGSVIGEAHSPAGLARARRTRNMTLTVTVLTARALAVPGFVAEFATGALTVSSYTKLEGKVRILKMVDKKVVMKMNCTMVANITSQQVLEQWCKNKVYM